MGLYWIEMFESSFLGPAGTNTCNVPRKGSPQKDPHIVDALTVQGVNPGDWPYEHSLSIPTPTPGPASARAPLSPPCDTHRLTPTQAQCHTLQTSLAVCQSTLSKLGQHSEDIAVTGLQGATQVLAYCPSPCPPSLPSPPIHAASPRRKFLVQHCHRL